MLLADSSESSTTIANAFKQEYPDRVTDSPLKVLDLIQVQTFQEWQETVRDYQTKADTAQEWAQVHGFIPPRLACHSSGSVVPGGGLGHPFRWPKGKRPLSGVTSRAARFTGVTRNLAQMGCPASRPFFPFGRQGSPSAPAGS